MPRTRRTDLAIEAQELWNEGADAQTSLSGVRASEELEDGFPVHTVDILDEVGAKALGKPCGSYVTITIDPYVRREDNAFTRGVHVIASALTDMLDGISPTAPILVIGLGNRAITPDAVGPLVHGHTLITRHLIDTAPQHFGNMRPVSSLACGVLGTTGVESGELVSAMVKKVSPACVIAVDALASRSINRLCRTIQIADTGITPGSGVGNHRNALNRETLGVPVIAVGVPTVVDGATMVADLMGTDELPTLGEGHDLLVTPKDIDTQVSDVSKLIGYSINLALQSTLTLSDVEMLLS